ncbi:hypothetical protein [Dialister sp.]|jgi:hypothetical protein|uniref:hypothetical protein n=1 Tax=Dialister sp. TaxID=1955814 RepID=UPI00399F708A
MKHQIFQTGNMARRTSILCFTFSIKEQRTYAMPLPTTAAASVRRAVWHGCSRKKA